MYDALSFPQRAGYVDPPQELLRESGDMGGEAKNVTRTTISVPSDLKARMDAVPEAVNWSAVASEAFEAKLLELASQRKGTNMDDVIARLRAAQEMDNREDCNEGRAAGEEWAKDKARPKQLKALAKLNEIEAHYDWEGMLGVFDNHRGIAWGLYEQMHQEDAFDRSDVEAFWEGILGGGGREKIDGFDFARGFVDAALAVWEKVEGEL
jgi:hypothetical protein